MLCLHDAGDNGASFGALEDALVAGNSPIAFDLPGHGRSGGLDSLGSIEAMAAHTRSFADALGLSAPVLLGEGMGAAVAIEAAAADPGWAQALVLCGGATARAQVDVIVDQLAQVTAGRARREFDQTGYAPDTAREVYMAAFGEWIKTDPRATLGDRRAQAAWDGTARLAAVTVPVLVVVGEFEDEVGKAAADELVAGLTGTTARIATLSGAGRHGVIEQPAALAALVSEFLSETVGATS